MKEIENHTIGTPEGNYCRQSPCMDNKNSGQNSKKK